MHDQVPFHDDSALLDRLLHAIKEEGREVVVLAGSALTMPLPETADRAAVPGVPLAPVIVQQIRKQLASSPDATKALDDALAGTVNAYQVAFQILQGHRGQDAANRCIREAVLQARLSSAEPPAAAVLNGEHGACRAIEQDVAGWALSPGAEALGRLAVAVPRFADIILTTNFDPLIEVSIRRASGTCHRSVLHSDGSLGQVHGDGTHVVHLHGDWYDSDTLHTPAQLLQSRPNLGRSLARLLRNRLFLVIAYSGWDDAFMSALSEVMQDEGAYPDVLWTFYDANEDRIRHNSRALLDKLTPGIARGRVAFYRGIDVHALLPRLAQHLIQGGSGAPLIGDQASDRLAKTSTTHTLSAISPAMEDPLTQRLEDALVRKQRLENAGLPTADVHKEILQIKREQRRGGQLRPGGMLGERYLLVEQIGRGGFATVWRARDGISGEDVAIKVLHPELAGDNIRRQRFFRGARIMAELAHPNIVRIRERKADDDGFYYFVMDFVPGGDLHRAVIEKRIDPNEAVPLMLKVVDAMAAAHKRGHLHRDIKPANILLAEDGDPLLTDFDLATAADTTGGTRTGALGTFLYAAPEMLDRPQDADARADVYALGVTLGFVLHGEKLPSGIMRDPVSFINSLPSSHMAKEVLKKAVSWDKEDRYASATDLLHALQGALQDVSQRPAAWGHSDLFLNAQQLHTVEENLGRLHGLWMKIRNIALRSEPVDGDPEYEYLHEEYARIQRSLPPINGWKPLADSRSDIVRAGREIARYRSGLEHRRREWKQKEVSLLINKIDKLLIGIHGNVSINNDNFSERVSDEQWTDFKRAMEHLTELLASDVQDIKEWGTLSRHIHFGQYIDLKNIVEDDWPAVRRQLRHKFGAITVEPEFLVRDSMPAPLPAPEFDISVSSRLQPVAQAALEILNTVCNFSDFAQHIKGVQVSMATHLGSYQHGIYGWPSSICVSVKFGDWVEIQGIDPAEMSGHAHHYNLGCGRRPGLYTTKSGGAKLCRARKHSEDGCDDWFLALPAMAEVMPQLYGSILRDASLYADGEGWPKFSKTMDTNTGEVPDYSPREWKHLQTTEQNTILERWTARRAAELLWEPEPRFLQITVGSDTYKGYLDNISRCVFRFVRGDPEMRQFILDGYKHAKVAPSSLEESMVCVHDACFSSWGSIGFSNGSTVSFWI